MLADPAPAALFAVAPLTVMLAHPTPAALSAVAPHTTVLADPAAPALLALVLPAVVRAEPLPMAVSAHCTAALGTSASAATTTSAAAAHAAAAAVADVTPGVPRQPVDKLLLLLALRQSRLRAEILQARDGLRTDARVPHEANQPRQG